MHGQHRVIVVRVVTIVRQIGNRQLSEITKHGLVLGPVSGSLQIMNLVSVHAAQHYEVI